ncbi:MAG: PH domain-containing protein, partial [Halanaeroarchaeum sp.]
MKLHRLTILLEGAGRAVGVGVAGFALGSVAGSFLAARGVLPPLGATAGVPLAILFGAAAFAYEIAHYRHFSYEVTEDTLDITAGVFFRREREIPLGRVQNVDIERDVLARILQVAVVSIETAGGGETEAQLRYVGVPEARRVQEEIRKRKRSARAAVDEQEAPRREEHIFELDDADLLLLSVLSFDARLLSVLVFGAPMVRPYLPAIGSPSGATMQLFTVGGLLVSALVLWGLS